MNEMSATHTGVSVRDDLATTECSGLMNPDTHLGENTRHREVFDEQATTYVYYRVQTRGGGLGIGPGL